MVYIVSMFLRVLVLAHPVCPSIKGHYMVVVLCSCYVYLTHTRKYSKLVRSVNTKHSYAVSAIPYIVSLPNDIRGKKTK